MSFSDDMLDVVVRACQDDFDKCADNLENCIKSSCQAKRISNSITKEKVSDTEYIVGVDGDKVKATSPQNVDYSIYYWKGTKAHDVYAGAITGRPNYRQALKFQWNGRTVYAKHTHPKGMKAHPFIEDGIKKFKGG